MAVTQINVRCENIVTLKELAISVLAKTQSSLSNKKGYRKSPSTANQSLILTEFPLNRLLSILFYTLKFLSASEKTKSFL